ncbi:hypothetical protein E2562_034964, partial [Oryza meyeriana var. granulata]
GASFAGDLVVAVPTEGTGVSDMRRRATGGCRSIAQCRPTTPPHRCPAALPLLVRGGDASSAGDLVVAVPRRTWVPATGNT